MILMMKKLKPFLDTAAIMAQNLNEYLAEHHGEGFKPIPHYFASGDFLTYYAREDRCYAQQVDNLLTVYLALGSNELVGCKITGVKHILQTAGNFGVTARSEAVRLGLFLFLGAALAKDKAQKQRYEDVGRLAQHATLDPTELQAV
jgi:hypothetical protein